MSDSFRYRQHLRAALRMAARHAPDPERAASEALHWLDEVAPQPDGSKGWRHARVTHSTLYDDAVQLRARITELRAEGKTNAEIAEAVNRSESRVEHLVVELGLTGGGA